MTHTIVERFNWLTPSGATVAIHCTPPAGSVRKSTGFRILRDGVALFPSCPPFATREEAEAKLATLTA